MMKNYVIQTDTFKKIENDKINFDFMVLYPNPQYFGDIKQAIVGYGLVFEGLTDSNYDMEEFMKGLSENPYLSSYSKKMAFKVVKKQNKGVSSSVVAERLCNQNNDCLMESYITGEETYVLSDNEMSLEITLLIDMGNIKLYINGSSVWIEDNSTGTKKQFYVYLD